MSLSIVAAKDIEQAIEILASRPRKTVKDHLAEEPEGVGNFLYDFRAAFTNYQCYSVALVYLFMWMSTFGVSSKKTL